MAKGFLVDYEFCTGCHSCEIACAVSHDLPNDQAGIVLRHVGPWEMENGRWEDTYIPAYTDACNLCANGEAAHDGVPMCAHHCQANILRFGDVEELAKVLIEKPKQMLYNLR